ncbi:MAG: enoyl-CoA hydratase/isomerase family protein [Promethearchaeota archaeon]
MTEKKRKPYLLTQEGAVAIISINYPPWNRMTLEFIDKLERLIPKLAKDKSVRAIVLTAEDEENFSVGMDLKQMAQKGRLAAEEGAKIGLPEMDLGTVPAWGGSTRLTRCVGRTYALDMILRGRKISGPEAYRIGLVTEVVPNKELKNRAIELGKELAEMPALAVSEMIRCIVGYEDQSLQEGLYQERQAVLNTVGTKDSMEGNMAFLQKRKPKFNQP